MEQVGGGAASLSDTAAQFPFVVLGNKVDKVRCYVTRSILFSGYCSHPSTAILT
jgi:hypothetical protein